MTFKREDGFLVDTKHAGTTETRVHLFNGMCFTVLWRNYNDDWEVCANNPGIAVDLIHIVLQDWGAFMDIPIQDQKSFHGVTNTAYNNGHNVYRLHRSNNVVYEILWFTYGQKDIKLEPPSFVGTVDALQKLVDKVVSA